MENSLNFGIETADFLTNLFEKYHFSFLYDFGLESNVSGGIYNKSDFNSVISIIFLYFESSFF